MGDDKVIVDRRSGSFKKYIAVGVTAFLVIAAAVILAFIFINQGDVDKHISKVTSALAPVMVGAIFAYLMNPLVTKIERLLLRTVLRKSKSISGARKAARAISIVLTLLFVLLVIAFLTYLLVPELTATIATIVTNVPDQADRFLKWFDSLDLKSSTIGTMLDTVIHKVTDYFENFIETDLASKATGILGSVASGVWSVFGVIYNILIGLVFSIYMLTTKEKFSAQARKLVFAVFKRKKANYIIRISKACHQKFTGAITGKILDSAVVGLLCFLGMSIFRFPYAALISVIVGVTNVIPFFGPYIGAVPSALLILLVDPWQCLYFVIFVLVLQQIDCNLLDPRIVGGSIGLSPFWVLFACVVFGSLFGIMGLLLGVPFTACVYMILKEIFDNKLKRKGLSPVTDDYLLIDHIDETEMVLVNKSEKHK